MRIDDVLNLLIYVVIPLLSVVILFFVKRERLWAAPLISTPLACIVYLIMFRISGIEISKLLTENEWRTFFLLAMVIQLVIAIVFTAVACFAANILEQKK